MGNVVGFGATVGANSFVINGGRVKFQPSTPTTTGSKYLLSGQPVYHVFTGGTGEIDVSLVATETTRPGIYYKVSLETPDSEGNFQFYSELPGVLRVPSGVGPFDIADLMYASANPAMAWVGPDYPSNAPPSLGTWWLVTDPASPDYGWLMEWS